ncbi:putative murein hydrolase (TIGR00659 family) [Paenibacillus cellulosilyticus]|uniref:Putative murein hydrolase (TIGR00659 family) n=1 Tax=Paenibacillus cellulosilyticus TaxID=375489 RepID=A0A2V2YXC6_9BACL|nr:LrgB family protein [Paenibacillus cellulosilyticus]PWW06478.1 putative murein hydrolase (TIGR00659 family) [Paenibacillus cellulosilyticus]QKS46180.1 LrgB family protein [Paenibacillus cellulosilyticus]
MIPILCLLVTIGIYVASRLLYTRFPIFILSPMLITPVLLVGILLVTGIPYGDFNSGAHWLSDLLKPATVALAVPLYRNYPILKKHALEIVCGVSAGSAASVICAAAAGGFFHLNATLTESLIPRSVTTPIAMNLSATLGGNPAFTAALVMITGLTGSLFGPAIIRMLRVESDVTRGVMLGTSAHGAGTSKAFELGSLAGAIASVSMIIAALLAIVAMPAFARLIY